MDKKNYGYLALQAFIFKDAIAFLANGTGNYQVLLLLMYG